MKVKTWGAALNDGDAVHQRDADHPVRNDASDGEPSLFCTWAYALDRLEMYGWDRSEAKKKLESGSTIGNVGETSWTLA